MTTPQPSHTIDAAQCLVFYAPRHEVLHRRVSSDQTISYQGRYYQTSYQHGDVVLVEPQPEQNAVRILGLHVPQTGILASSARFRSRGHIAHAANNHRRLDSLTTADKTTSNPACLYCHAIAPATAPARKYADKTDSEHGEHGAVSPDEGKILLPLYDYDTQCSDR